MCGILITLGENKEAIESISHRGIEYNTMNIDGVHLTHHRLPIQTMDGDDWSQPLEISDGIYMMFNGEIFNYDRNVYSSDTEYLSNLFRNYDGDNIQMFAALYAPYINMWDGFWAIVIYNSKTRKITAFTDPLGKKLLYMNSAGEICSEIKGLIRKDSTIDNSYISSVRKWGYNKDPRTPYTDIKRITPNTIIQYDIDSPEFVTEYREYNKSFNSPIDELRGADYETHMNWLWDKMEESIKNRLVSKGYPISVLVSGGLDSSIIAAFLKKLDSEVNWFSIENGESEFVDLLSMHLDIPVDFLTYEMDDSKNSEIYKKWNETPVDLGSVLPQYYLFEAIRNKNEYRMVISGDGADELFGGYKRIHEYDSQGSDIFEELTYYHLPRLDKMSMAHTLELRSPFLNLDIVRFACHLPLEWRKDKKILKDTFGPMLPDGIVNREKAPLKNPSIKKDKLTYRQKAVDLFLS